MYNLYKGGIPVSYLRVRKFNIDETQREVSWKSSWLKSLLPGLTTLVRMGSPEEGRIGELAGRIVDHMFNSSWQMYQLLPEHRHLELYDTQAVHAYVRQASQQALIYSAASMGLSGSGLTRIQTLICSEMLKVWGIYYREYHCMQPVSERQVSVCEDKDAFISTQVLEYLEEIQRPVDEYKKYESVALAVLDRVNDGIAQRNRRLAGQSVPWVPLAFLEPCDLAAIAVGTDAYLLPGFMELLQEEPWIIDLRSSKRRDYLAAVEREVDRMGICFRA